MGLEFVLARRNVAAFVAGVDFADLVERLDVAIERGFVGKNDLAVGAFEVITGHVEVVKTRLDEKLVGGSGSGAERRQRLDLSGGGSGGGSGGDGGGRMRRRRWKLHQRQGMMRTLQEVGEMRMRLLLLLKVLLLLLMG